MVRVPKAWGKDGEPLAEAALLAFPYPEAAVVSEETLGAQTLAIAADLPERPLVVGGCCCAHIGAVEGLAARYERLAVVWLDAHGDLNTPETSPSGNLWGMPLRMILDSAAVRLEDVVLVGARNLDPPEALFVTRAGLAIGSDGIARALEGVDAVYVALDCDVLDPSEVASFVPEPKGMTLAEADRLLRRVADAAPVAGAGVTGSLPDPANIEPVTRLLRALGL